MREHPSSEQLELYRRRALSPDLFLSIERHVSVCPICSEQCHTPDRMQADYETLLASLLPAPDDEAYHLTKAEMAGFVQHKLDEVSLETAESHLEVCAECVQAVEDLRAASFEKSYGHQSGAGVFAFFTALSRPAQLAAVLLIATVLILMTLLLIRSRTAPARDEIVNQNKQNAPLSNSQEEQPRLSDKDAASDNGEQTLSPSEEEATQGDVAAIEKLSPALHKVIESALTTGRLERPNVLAELKGTSGTLLGETVDGQPFRLLSPVGKVVQSSRPTFRWRPLAGASSYVVTVVDNKLNAVVTSEQLAKTEWSLPSSLKRGGIYSWQVTAIKDGTQITSPVMPSPQAKFKILDQTSDEELRRVKRVAPNYHLGLGVLYARAGLLDEAEQEFQAELKANPRSASARELLRSLRSMKK